VPSTKKVKELAKELAYLIALRDEDIDTTDIPEVVDGRGAERGRFYRPMKQAVTIRLDADIVAWFKSHAPTYQTAINSALREYMLDKSFGRRRKGARTRATASK
jgi:uncharacterized protein (DUF4415 family)